MQATLRRVACFLTPCNHRFAYFFQLPSHPPSCSWTLIKNTLSHYYYTSIYSYVGSFQAGVKLSCFFLASLACSVMITRLILHRELCWRKKLNGEVTAEVKTRISTDYESFIGYERIVCNWFGKWMKTDYRCIFILTGLLFEFSLMSI